MEDSSESENDRASLHNSLNQVQEWLQNARNSTISTGNPTKFTGKFQTVVPKLLVNSSWMGANIATQQQQLQL